MAIIKKGINGAFSGTVGNTVGSSWRQIDYIKSLPKPSNKPASERQLAQRAKFAMAVSFLRPIKPLLNIGFSDKAQGKQTGFNRALQTLMNDAVRGAYPDFTIDLSAVTFARGGLNAPTSLVVEQDDGIILRWDPLVNKYNSFADDELLVIAYNESKGFMNVYDGARREDGNMSIPLPPSFVGDEIAFWGFMVHRDGQKTSDSVFAGQLVIAEADLESESESESEP